LSADHGGQAMLDAEFHAFGKQDEFNKTLLSKAFPNPTNGRVIITLDFIKSPVSKVIIENVIGRCILSYEPASNGEESTKIGLDLSNYSTGVYYYRIVTTGTQTANGIILIVK
jgi:hypothetical protein